MKLKFIRNWNNVYLRGFGSFIVKTRAEKTGRNISKNTTIKILHTTFLHSNLQKFLLKE
jgi:nucleoid DNA-binding protein